MTFPQRCFCFLCAALAVFVVEAAWIDGVPYFPIEISRACAGPLGTRRLMEVAFMAVGMCLFMSTLPEVKVSCLGLVVLALIPDSVSIVGHMVGVGIMFLGAVVLAWRKPPVAPIVIGCVVVFGLRVVAKSAAVTLFELPHQVPVGMLSDGWACIDWIKTRSFDIMFGRGPPPDPNTLLVFRCTAVAQWAILFTMGYTLATYGMDTDFTVPKLKKNE